MLTQRPTPAFLSQEAARRLPRFSLGLLLAAFILSGLWSRDLWTLRDAMTFGIAESMLSEGGAAWLLPMVDGAPAPYSGPISGWLAALFMSLFSGLMGEVSAYRLTSLLWFALTTATLWQAAVKLARRPEAQPVAFAFGGEANSESFSRTVADCAALLFVATFGILARQHEPIPGTALLSFASLNLLALTVSLRRPLAGALLAGLAAGLAAVASSVAAGLWLMFASLVIHAFARTLPGERDLKLLAVLGGFLLPAALWAGAALALHPAEAQPWLKAWAENQAALFGIGSSETVLWLTRTFLWYLCPAWPLALWGLFSWRRQLDRTHILIPATIVGACTAAGLATQPSGAEPLLLASIPSVALLAAFGLVTLRQSRENLLDWFGISVSSLAALALWLYWFAALLGVPPKMAHSIRMLAPGFEPVFGPGFALSVAALVLWCVFVVWRVTHRPVVIWRGPWLSAAGMTLCVVTFLGLWHSAIDINRSYQEPAREIAAEARRITGEDSPLIEGDQLSLGIRAALSRGGVNRFTRPGESARVRLVRLRNDAAPANALTREISRPHTDESFYLVPGRAR